MGYWLGQPKQDVARNGVFQLAVPLPAGFTRLGWPAISPDGRWLVFTARKDADPLGLWLVDLTSQAIRAVTGTESGTYPFWSPDSRSIGFADLDKGVLQKVSVEGGVPQLVAEGLRLRCRGASSSSNGDVLYGESEGPLRLIHGGGPARPVTSLDRSAGERSHRFPVFLPDGHHFLYLAVTSGNPTARSTRAIPGQTCAKRSRPASRMLLYLLEVSFSCTEASWFRGGSTRIPWN